MPFRRLKNILVTLLLPLTLGACATVDAPGPTAADVARGDEASGDVHWGGQIVAVENRPEVTRIEVLALPEDLQGVPLILIGNRVLAGGEHAEERIPEIVDYEAAQQILVVLGQRGYI